MLPLKAMPILKLIIHKLRVKLIRIKRRLPSSNRPMPLLLKNRDIQRKPSPKPASNPLPFHKVLVPRPARAAPARQVRFLRRRMAAEDLALRHGVWHRAHAPRLTRLPAPLTSREPQHPLRSLAPQRAREHAHHRRRAVRRVLGQIRAAHHQRLAGADAAHAEGPG